MDSTISREAAIAAADRADYIGLAVEDVKAVTDEVVKELKKLPSAEPHGQWIHRPIEEWGASNCKCSLCGTEYFFPLLLKGGADNYCGNCGAKMEK